MLTRIESFFRRMRRSISRSEWAVKMLKLPRVESHAACPGLVMIQVDGLGYKQFQAAMREGNLPFLKFLMDRQHYVLHSGFSGVPSTTPAVQGEIFYGVKGSVPAFHFRDRVSGQVFTMYECGAASHVEKRIRKKSTPLLAGGSAYSDVFAGGSNESHFCPATLSLKDILGNPNPFWILLFFLYLDILLRIIVLFVIELWLAVYDFVRGCLTGKGFFEELKFIVLRVVISVVLRELIVMGAQIDLARGMPVVHMNFFGYDEQAHRRGPSSRFAHWSLRGIDDSIARIWKSARRASTREYELWIYSDHGQEPTVPYEWINKKSLQKALEPIFGPVVHRRSSGQLFQGAHTYGHKLTGDQLVVTAMGPVGHVYILSELEEADKQRLARRLVEEAGIPIVLLPMATPAGDGSPRAEAWTARKKFILPEESAGLLGEGHPFLEEAGKDLVDLAHHPDAGTFILCGWRKGDATITFVIENGSHAGPGYDETHSFALLSSDAPIEVRERGYIRPIDIRNAALKFLGKEPESVRFPEIAVVPKQIRFMTYNVHSCVGMDGKLSPERIARVIARQKPDIVALQELDVGRSRSGNVDQAQIIAEKLKMQFHFHPSLRMEEERYGDAILSRFPMQVIKSSSLPRLENRLDLEPRGALWARIQAGPLAFHVINCHLSLWPPERLIQVEALVGPDWIGSADCDEAVVLLGDFNAWPGTVAYRHLCHKLRDAQKCLARKPLNTYTGRYPLSRIDHMFLGSRVRVANVAVPATELDKVASDHLPLIMDAEILAPEMPSAVGEKLGMELETISETERKEVSS